MIYETDTMKWIDGWHTWVTLKMETNPDEMDKWADIFNELLRMMWVMA